MRQYCFKGPDGNLLRETLSDDIGHTMHKAGWFAPALRTREQNMAALREARRKGYRIVRMETREEP